MPTPLTPPRATRGKTTGKAVIRSFIHDILHGSDPGFKPLYTQGRFNQMVEGLSSEREYNIYLGYVAVFNGLSEEYVRSQAYSQQAQHGLLHLQVTLSEVARAEKAKGFFENVRSLFTSIEDIEKDPALCATILSYHDTLLWPALRGLAAYDALIGILTDVLDIPELAGLKAQTDDLARDLAAYQCDIENLELLHPLRWQLFRPVTLSEAAPPAAAQSAVREAFIGPTPWPTGIVQQQFVRLLED